MQIKELADRAGVTVKAVRYYESRGLLAPRRAGNGYRDYAEVDVQVVREIRALRGELAGLLREAESYRPKPEGEKR